MWVWVLCLSVWKYSVWWDQPKSFIPAKTNLSDCQYFIKEELFWRAARHRRPTTTTPPLQLCSVLRPFVLSSSRASVVWATFVACLFCTAPNSTHPVGGRVFVCLYCIIRSTKREIRLFANKGYIENRYRQIWRTTRRPKEQRIVVTHEETYWFVLCGERFIVGPVINRNDWLMYKTAFAGIVIPITQDHPSTEDW